MSTQTQPVYDAAVYSTSRPTFPPRLIKLILSYAGSTSGSSKRTALDLGCGTGQVTKLLLQSDVFDQVIAADASPGMLEQAKKDSVNWGESIAGKLKLVTASAEDVADHIEAKSVDLITAGQAAHWFDKGRLWPALQKVLKPGGAVVFWGYTSFFSVPARPDLRPFMTDFFWGPEPDGLGGCWDLPGTAIHDNRLKDIQFPAESNLWDRRSAKRIFFAGPDYDPTEDKTYVSLPELSLGSANLQREELSDPEEEITTDVIFTIPNLTWSAIAGYFRSWSGYRNYQKRHPGDKEREARGADGDVVDRFMHRLRSRLSDQAHGVDVEWPVYMMMIKKKGD